VTPGRCAATGMLAAAFLGSIAGCATDPEGPRVSAEPARLELVREWLRPDLSPETDWITHPTSMVFDPATDHLFIQGEATPRWIDLYEMPLIRAWREEVAAKLRRMRRMGGGRTWMQPSHHGVGASRVVAPAGPPDLMVNGPEVWRIDVDTGDVDRFDFGVPLIGYQLAVAWPRIFTSHGREGTVLEYRVPAGEGSDRSGTEAARGRE